MRLLDMFSWGRKSAVGGDAYGVFAELLRTAATSKAGVQVTKDTALKVAVVFCCLRVLMDGVSQVPFKVLRKQPSPTNVSRHPTIVEAVEHPLYDVLHRQPNGWQSSFDFRQTLVMHAALAGSAYAFKNRVKVLGEDYWELILLNPMRVSVKQLDDWSITYRYAAPNGNTIVFQQGDIWHLRGPSWDGVTGLDVLNLAREAVGLSLVTEQSHATLHAKGVRPSGTYSIDGTLSDAQHQQIVQYLRQQAGAENSGAPLILDRGAKWLNTAMSGVDAQHLETRGHQIEEVCRFFRVLPIMVGYSGGKTPTYASAEQMFLAHVVHTLMPWYERIQQSADISLLTRQERRDGYYTKLSEAGLLRGALRDTSEYLAGLVQVGVMERNEARGKLDLNPLPGLDDPLTPINLTAPNPANAADTTDAGA